jgi:acetyltransferase-like isoleucine patch superfamily enzyme
MNVNIIDHGYKFFPHFFIVDLVNSKKKIVIGENNWFSSNVSILKNVRIGNSVVVAYGTILSNDTIQSNTFVKSDVMVNMSEIVIKN